VVAYADLVYLCAGVTGGSGLIGKDPLSLVTPNLLIHANVFQAAREAGVKKVVCLSSTTGYPDTDLPMQEDDYFTGEIHPAYFNPGHTRRFIERLGAMYPELQIVFLRPSVVYGPGDDFDPETSHVIPALVRKVAERQNPITVWGDGSNWRDGVYIDDMVRAMILAGDAPAGAYNIASGEGMTVTQMLVHLQAASGHHPQIEYDETKPSMLKKRVLNIEKAKRVMGWEPGVRMQDGLARTLDWYRANAR
jgi:GDP-L-fucose synthase